MTETIPCPGCKAELVLAGFPAGQTAQCPRCGNVFDPRGVPFPPPRVAAGPSPAKALDADFSAFPENLDELTDDESLRYQPLRGEWKASAAMIALALSVLSYGLELYVHFETSRLIQMEEDLLFRQPVLFPRRNFHAEDKQLREVHQRSVDLGQLQRVSSAVHHLTYWPAVIFVLIWLHQAASNLRILKTSGLSHSPGGAAISFFIPFANLYQPYAAVQEIWRASNPLTSRDPIAWRGTHQGALVILWWLAFLVAAVLWLMGMWIGNDDFLDGGPPRVFHGGVVQMRTWCVSNILMILAGATLIAVIRDIRVRQRQRHARIYDAAD